MKKQTITRGVITTAAVLGLALAGCGSDTKSEGDASTEETTSAAADASTSAAAPAAPPTGESGKQYTIVDYIKDNGITEAAAKRGTPGTPTVNLPVLPGWMDAGPATPEWAFSQLVYTDPAFAQAPPTITAIMSKLTGEVDPAKILELAPNELKNLPGFEGGDDGKPGKLAGFDAVQVGGSYLRDGQNLMVAQKTTVIPADDALYVLQINAEGTDQQMGPLMDATAAIDDQTTITP